MTKFYIPTFKRIDFEKYVRSLENKIKIELDKFDKFFLLFD